VSCAETYRAIGGDETIEGTWGPLCEYAPGAHERYYDLVVENSGEATLALDSGDADPVLVLSRISYSNGAASLTTLTSNDDFDGSTTRSRIMHTLDPGRYRIHAQAKNAGAMGSFTLTVSGLGASPLSSCADTLQSFSADHTVTGEWGPGCDRDRTPDEQPYYQRSYDLVVKQRETLTLVLTSNDADPLLRLYDAERVLLASNDDHNGSTSRSRIVHNFERGTYRIEASTKNPETAGSFKLEVTRGVRSFTDNVECGSIPPHRIVDGETATGQWSADCLSTYFTFDTNIPTASYHITLSAVDATGKEVAVDLFLVEGPSPFSYSRLDILALEDAGNESVAGIWSDGETMWATDRDDFKIYAYNMATRARDIAKDFDTLSAAGNRAPRGIWSDGETMWVADGADDKIYAYNMATRLRDSDKDFDDTLSGAGNTSPEGIWSDGETMWVADWDDNKIYAYNMSSKAQDSAKDITLATENTNPGGIWSDGTTMWVADNGDDKLFAYNMATGARDSAKDIDDLDVHSFTVPWGIWSDGEVVWVADWTGATPHIHAFSLRDGSRGGALEGSSERLTSSGLRSDLDAWVRGVLTTEGAYSYEARLSPHQPQGKLITPGIQRLSPLPVKVIREDVREPSVTYPVTFTLTHRSSPLGKARNTGVGGDSGPTGPDTAPTVTDTSQFKTHYFLVGQSVSLTLPAADPASGNGGPYDYNLWHKGAGKSFADEAINGLRFDPLTRTLTGTPETEGEWALSYVVHDGDGNRNAATDAFRERDSLKIVVEPDGQAVGNTGPQQAKLGPPINHAPSFDANIVTTLEVAENSPAGTNVGAPITATDPDEGDTLTYSLSGDDAASFAIDNAGQITTITGVTYDYEVRSYLVEPSYSLTVTADDGNGGRISTPVTVSLTDVADAPAENLAPEFHEGESTTREVAENSPAGTNVGQPVTAYDLNGDALSYIALDGADGAAFALDADTGRLTTVAGATYDYETKSSYQFMVIVMEMETNEGYLSGISVTVNLTDEDETQAEGDSGPQQQQSEPEPPANQAPSFAANVETTLEVAENSASGTNVGSPITATDPDAGDTLTYSLSGTDAASFAIGSSTGQITTKSGVTYDYESSKSSYTLAVDVSDGNGGTDSAPVTVRLTDVNEDPAFAGSSATLEVAENSAAGTNVGAAVTATDPDADDTLSYSLSGTDAASFAIDSSTGQITTKSGVTYDYESKKTYSVTVSASDGNGGTDSIAVTVNLTDVEETPPVVVEPDPPAPTPPTADAGADFDGKRGEVLTLNGSGTPHADGSQTLTYQWRISDASDDELVTVGADFLANADQAEAEFTMPRRKNMTDRSTLDDGNWIEFELTVTDGDGEQSTDTVRVTISGTTWKPKE